MAANSQSSCRACPTGTYSHAKGEVVMRKTRAQVHRHNSKVYQFGGIAGNVILFCPTVGVASKRPECLLHDFFQDLLCIQRARALF